MRSDFNTQIERLYTQGDNPPKTPPITAELMRHCLDRGRVLQAQEAQRLLGLATSSAHGVVSATTSALLDAVRSMRRTHPSRG